MADQFDIKWIDHGREPRNPPNPAYPNGVDIRAGGHVLQARCKTPLPYPAKRCGAYSVTCRVCGLKVAITTAGRADDPRSVELHCLPHQTGTA